MLKKVETQREIKIFGEYKVECIKYHQKYANDMNLEDVVVKEYDFERAIRHIGEKNYYQYLIMSDNNIIGAIEYQNTKSKIDNKEIIYIDIIFIEEKYRGKGIAKEIIKNLKEKEDKRIELECWYEMPANNLYERLQMKKIKTRYQL